MAVEQGWRRRFAFIDLEPSQIETLIEPFAAGARVLEAVPLSGGLRNTNYRLRLSSRPEPVVLRLFSADPSACPREAALERLVAGRVPVPEVLHSEPAADPPWNIVSWVAADRFDHVLRTADDEQVRALSRDAGRVLARIHAFTFPAAGFLGPDLSVGAFDGYSGDWSEMLTDWLLHGRSGARLGPRLTERLLRFIADNAPRMKALGTQAHLLHSDYKPWNLLVRGSDIAAVLDWEFAFSGWPLNDVGIYLFNSDPACTKSPTTRTDIEACFNVIENSHGYPGGHPSADANRTGWSVSPAAGFQAGVSDLGNRDEMPDRLLAWLRSTRTVTIACEAPRSGPSTS